MPDQLELTLPRRIALVVRPGFSLTPFAALLGALNLANELSGTTLYAPFICSAGASPVTAAEGASVLPQSISAARQAPHAVFVLGAPPSGGDGRLGSWLDRQRRRTAGVHCPGGPNALLSLIAREHGARLAARIREHLLAAGLLPLEAARRLVERARLEERSSRLAAAVRLMEANVETPLKLPALAARVGLSMRQLERLSQVHLGCSPQSQYLRIRLTHADFLLRSTDLGVAEVAACIGLSSASYFSRRYAALFGRSPRSVRS